MELQTHLSNVEFFIISTLIPIGITGITRSLAFIKKEFKLDSLKSNPIKQNNKLYANDEDYEDDYLKQENLNRILRLIQTRTQPIMINVVYEKSKNPSNLIPKNSYPEGFGKKSNLVYFLKFVAEQEATWESQKFLADILQYEKMLGDIPQILTSGEYSNTSVLISKFSQ